MAESNSPRLGIRRWSAGTDTFSRAELDSSFGQLETLAAIDKQGTFASRPAAGVQGTYYWDTTNAVLWRDNASAWSVVGAKVLDGLAKGSTAASVPFTVDTFNASQTANLLEVKNNGTAVFKVLPSGGVESSGPISGTYASLVNGTAATAALNVRGAASQSAPLFRLQNNASTSQFEVSNTGTITSSYLTNTATSAVVGAGSPSTVANASIWTGAAALEVRMKNSGFYDFLYLNHADPAPGTALSRRIGILMKVGAEDSAAYTRSGAISIRSQSANFDSPEMVFEVGGSEMWKMRPLLSEGSTTPFPVRSNGGYFRAVPVQDGAFHASNTKIGTQMDGNNMYFRVPNDTNQYMWYAGGTHADTLADPGTGGITLATLSPFAGQGWLRTGRLQLTGISDAHGGATSPTLGIGDLSGTNMMFDNNEIMSVNNGDVDSAQLMLQIDGGRLDLGSSLTRTYVNSIRFNIGTTFPGSPETGSIWIRTTSAGGIFRWNGSSWVSQV